MTLIAETKCDREVVRAPNFDEVWAEHHGLVFWWAAYLKKRFKRPKEEFLGWLTLRLNSAALSWDPGRSTFASWYGFRLYENYVQEVHVRSNEYSAMRASTLHRGATREMGHDAIERAMSTCDRDADARHDAEEMLGTLKPMEIAALRLWLLEFTLEEIGVLLERSKEWVRVLVTRSLSVLDDKFVKGVKKCKARRAHSVTATGLRPRRGPTGRSRQSVSLVARAAR